MGKVAYWLECLFPVCKVNGPSLTRKLTHYSPSSGWVPSGNLGEIKADRKGAGYPTSCTNDPREVFSLTCTP